MCNNSSFHWLPWQQESKIAQKQENDHFCNVCDTKVRSNNNPKQHTTLPLCLINSFYMIETFWDLKYIHLKMMIPQMRSLSTIWLKMSHFVRSVSDNGTCSIKLKLSTGEFVNVYFGNFQWLPWQR